MTYTVKNRTETISNQIKRLVSLWMTQYDTTYIEVTTTQMKVVLIIIRRPLRFNCDSFRDQDPRVWNHTEYKECNETQKTKQNLWMKLSWNRKCAAVDSECDVYTSNSSSSPLWGSEALSRCWSSFTESLKSTTTNNSRTSGVEHRNKHSSISCCVLISLWRHNNTVKHGLTERELIQL